ncbi:MAG TPA: TspO/MBR family protein [Chitinophagaceae bacterium]|nr:TspO/MBR family protein [Chitinophagaceae bacterium]
MKKGFRLLISVLIPVFVGLLSGFFTASGVKGWFQTITKPGWNPPNWVFAPVWTTLYILMGIALYLIWQRQTNATQKKQAIIFWIVQLILNAAWSFLFFQQHAIGLALIEIILLWIAIFITILLFARINKTAAWLLVPYISWVSFASLLTYAIWRLNI